MSIHYACPVVMADCWCSQTSVAIPVQWVSEGITASCGTECGPGCPMRPSDAFETSPEAATTGKKKSMAKFNPATYDAKTDSSAGLSHGGVRLEHMTDLILQVSDGDCPCGCAEAPDRDKAVFRMGHDARLKGKLARAGAADVQVVIVDALRNVREITSPIEYASRFTSAKFDWAAYVTAAIAKSKGEPAPVTEAPVEAAEIPAAEFSSGEEPIAEIA